jgi:hypothetical protein
LTILTALLWTGIGAGLALIVLFSQHWSIRLIEPGKPMLSHTLIIGGAIIRWMIIAAFLMIALSNSMSTMLVAFSALMVFRLIFTFLWNHFFLSKSLKNTLVIKEKQWRV